MLIPDSVEQSLPRNDRQVEGFPVALSPALAVEGLEGTLEWAAGHSDAILDLLADRGAIVFRDFPIANAQEFDRFIGAFGLESFTYAESLSNAVRMNVTERVFTANEAPPSVEIFLHHEMAQTPLFPSRLFFYCEVAPSQGGATPLCRSDRLLEELQVTEPDFVERCETLGVRYVNVMPGSDDAGSGQGRSWRSTLGVDTTHEAERRLESLGYDFEWLHEEALRVTTAALPAVRELKDGRRVFFNQLIAAFRGWKDTRNDPGKSLRFGDDSPMDKAALATASSLADELSFDLQWKPGDVALLDNFMVMHGRRPFAGSRRVLASLVADSGDRLA